MTLFLDTSVLLAAAGSVTGASRFVVVNATSHGWHLVSSGYCLQEGQRNLGKLCPNGANDWSSIIEPRIHRVPDIVATPRALVLLKSKVRPVLVSALAAKSVALLTLDRADFHDALGRQIYGMAIRTPADFLIEQRRAGRI